MARWLHLDRNAYFVGRAVKGWDNLGEIECQNERMTFVSEADGGLTPFIRDGALQEDDYLGKTNNPSLMG